MSNPGQTLITHLTTTITASTTTATTTPTTTTSTVTKKQAVAGKSDLKDAPLGSQRLLTDGARFGIFGSEIRLPEVFEIQQLTELSPELVDGDRFLGCLEFKIKFRLTCFFLSGQKL